MLIMNDHEGPGVVPGRYPWEAIPIRDGPIPHEIASEEQRVQADGFASRLRAAATPASPA